MIAFLLSALLGLSWAGGADRTVGVARSGSMVVPEVPKLDILPTALNQPVVPLVPGASGVQTAPPALPEPLAVLPSAAPSIEPAGSGADAPKPVRQDDMAMPELQEVGKDIKPGGVFTEQMFSKVFDGLRQYRAPIGIDLSMIDPDDTGKIKSEKQAKKKLVRDQEKLNELQEKLYAERKHRVLIVLQGMDTAGKDGVIKHVMRSLNPQGVQVHSFKKPSEAEKKQHYLKRQIDALPDMGMIGIFNRSHYEELILPLVHPEWYPGLTREDWERRVQAVNAMEKDFAKKGGTIMKFLPHIDKPEQARRLQDRIDNPNKNWKFSDSDIAERAYWDRYMAALALVVERTNTPWAPWYVVPANNKWYRDYRIGNIIKKTLKRLKLKFPPPNPKLKGVKIPA